VDKTSEKYIKKVDKTSEKYIKKVDKTSEIWLNIGLISEKFLAENEY
jgi:hypothetical protein